jgi:hypothetical protein
MEKGNRKRTMEAVPLFVLNVIATLLIVRLLPSGRMVARTYLIWCRIMGAVALPLLLCGTVLLYWQGMEPNFDDGRFKAGTLATLVLVGLPLGGWLGKEAGQVRWKEAARE